LRTPWSIAFTSKNRALVAERRGTVRVIAEGKLLDEPIKTIPDVYELSESGLMGLTLDPEYQTNRFIYVCYTYKESNTLADKVVRYTDNITTLDEPKTVIETFPAAQIHAGCRIKFGPDKKLFVTAGDAANKSSAQDIKILSGKILRVNSDGSIPQDNPFPNSPVYSYGHRNPQGLDWHPETGVLYETEHGPSGNDGLPGGDEVNLIKKGSNYGWPLVSHEKSREGLESPKIVFTPAVAPAAGTFYKSDKIPEFKNNFFFATLKGEAIYRTKFSENGQEISSYEKLPGINFGRIREIVEGPDGALYFTTSNTDGRGTVRENDDKIYRYGY
jgi:aldose sugar dehydrogenase